MRRDLDELYQYLREKHFLDADKANQLMVMHAGWIQYAKNIFMWKMLTNAIDALVTQGELTTVKLDKYKDYRIAVVIDLFGRKELYASNGMTYVYIRW